MALSSTGTSATSIVSNNVHIAYELDENYPNPFNPSTTIKYGLPTISRVKLTVHDLSGQHIATIVDRIQPAGYYYQIWEGRVSSGIYLLKLEAVSIENNSKLFVKMLKMLLLK